MWLPLFFSACVSNMGDEEKDSVQNNMPISFGITKTNDWNNISSSRSETNSPFNAGDKIGIFAYYNESSTPDFMNNQEAQYDGATWKYSPVKYWPQKGSMLFYGYSPYNQSAISIDYNKNNSLPILYYENPQMDIDLLAASCVNVSCPSNSPVSLNFKHLLSKINFSFTNNAKNEDNATEYDPVIHMIQFGDVPYKGVFAYQFEDEGTPIWKSINNAETITIRRYTKDVNGVVINGGKYVIRDFTTYLLPNSHIGGDIILSINNVKHTCTIPSGKEIITEMNKEYTLNFIIESNGSNYFIASFSVWEDGGEIVGKLQ